MHKARLTESTIRCGILKEKRNLQHGNKFGYLISPYVGVRTLHPLILTRRRETILRIRSWKGR
jgi:hypothetical protein